MRIVREPTKFQSACSQKQSKMAYFVSMLRQRLNRFRRMLITRSDDGYFDRNPETYLKELRFKP